ncbi:hypothetical protein, partial [Paenibacillus polymyxa]|uniref:hypothetical protein n=1 Tax=Paenibacillus polymyxa TaxID=1406 RepID=UPI000A4F51DC
KVRTTIANDPVPNGLFIVTSFRSPTSFNLYGFVYTGSYNSSYAQEHPSLERTELKYNPPQSDLNEIP